MTVTDGDAWATSHELCIGNRELPTAPANCQLLLPTANCQLLLPTATHPFTSSSNVRMSLMAWSTSSFFVPS